MAKILIVDDESIVRHEFASALNRLGHTTVCASNGLLGWVFLCDNPDIDLVITDLVMPAMEGTELLQMIRTSSEFGALPIIITSGKTEGEEIDRLLQLGASRYIPKPIQHKELAEVVASLLERKSTSYVWDALGRLESLV